MVLETVQLRHHQVPALILGHLYIINIIIITAIRIIITAIIITLICHFLVVEVDPVSMSMFIWLQESDGSCSL